MIALVTGGSRNLGREVVLAFARAGAKVAFTWSRVETDAAETGRLLDALGVEWCAFKGDTADDKHAESVVADVVKRWGGLDVLVCCAGTNQVLPVALIDAADFDRAMAVNARGPFVFARAALKPMIRAKRGSIVCIGSFAAERVVQAPVHVAASKAALHGLVDALAKEVGRYQIRVNLVVPGLLEEGQSRALPEHRRAQYRTNAALGRLGRAAEIAETVRWLASDEASFLTGAHVIADGGL